MSTTINTITWSGLTTGQHQQYNRQDQILSSPCLWTTPTTPSNDSNIINNNINWSPKILVHYRQHIQQRQNNQHLDTTLPPTVQISKTCLNILITQVPTKEIQKISVIYSEKSFLSCLVYLVLRSSFFFHFFARLWENTSQAGHLVFSLSVKHKYKH